MQLTLRWSFNITRPNHLQTDFVVTAYEVLAILLICEPLGVASLVNQELSSLHITQYKG